MNDLRPFGLNFLEVDTNLQANNSNSDPKPPKKPTEPPRKFYTQAVTVTSTHDTM